MKAIQFTGAGGPEVVRYGEVAKPSPGRNEILLRVHAACANPADWKIRDGETLALSTIVYPIIPGWDASGRVEAIGEDVSGVNIGDEIVGILPICGSFADYAILSPAAIAPKPEALTHIEAAAVPAAGCTAWIGLFRVGGLRAGQRVLIHAAAGGVGHIAVQLARDAGAYVIGTASAANHDFVLGLGAHEVIDYQTQRVEEAVSDVDLVIDLVGGDVERRSWRVLKPGGLLASALRPIPQAEAPAGKRAALIRGVPTRAELTAIMSLAASGRLKAAIRAVFPLARAGEALELSKSGHGRGRIVIDVAGEMERRGLRP